MPTGIYERTDFHRQRIKETNAKHWSGKKRSADTKAKISASLMGKKYPLSRNKKISISLIGNKRSCGHFHSEEWKNRVSNKLKGRKISKEHLLKILKRKDKSRLECQFENIVKSIGLPYKFVGNGEVIIARKVPDFVNSEGKKIAVEVFYKKHKSKFRSNVDEWKAERAKIFHENGWEIVFFDETEVKEEIIKKRLQKYG